jgi:hypothetical protein
MNNFFEKALALSNRYYDEAIKMRLEEYGPNYADETPDPHNDSQIDILSELVAVYVKYGGNIPDKFSIKLSSYHNHDYLLMILEVIFYDLSIDYKIKSVSPAHSVSIYNQYASAHSYNITLSK